MGRASRRKRERDRAGGDSGASGTSAAPGSRTDHGREADGPEAPLIVVGGCPRSGTTLLRMMLDAHPRIACGPELKVLPMIAANCVRMLQGHGPLLREAYGLDEPAVMRTFGRQAEALLEPWRRRHGAARMAEKTPQNVHAFVQLAALLPESPFVHVIRDGRDVAASLLRQSWIDPATGRPLPYCSDLAEAAKYWVRCVRDGRRMLGTPAEDRYLEIRYERLVADPEPVLRELVAFLGEPWDPAMLEFHRRGGELPASERPSHGEDLSRPVHAGAVGRWRDAWSAEQVETFRRHGGALLAELGYAD